MKPESLKYPRGSSFVPRAARTISIIWTKIAVVFFALFVTNTSYSAQTDKIRLIVPSSELQYVQDASQPLSERLESDESILLSWIPADDGFQYFLSVTARGMSNGNGPTILFGWTEAYLSNNYSQLDNRYRPDWLQNSSDFQRADGVPNGVISLGAGWHHGGPKRNLSTTLRQRRLGFTEQAETSRARPAG